MVSYCTNITSVAAGRTLTAAVAASENDLGECMEVCKRENARSEDGSQTAPTRAERNSPTAGRSAPAVGDPGAWHWT